MMYWYPINGNHDPDMMGYIPYFVTDNDPRPAREQFAAHYVGGWNPYPGFTMQPDGSLAHKGDRTLVPLFEAKLRDEVIRFYRSAWVSVVQPDGSYEVARMD